MDGHAEGLEDLRCAGALLEHRLRVEGDAIVALGLMRE
jgi:hypothetical protein